MRDSTAVVRGRGNRHVNRRRAVGKPDDRVCGATGGRGFGLHLHARDGDGFVGGPSGAGPGGSQRAGQEDVLLSARTVIERF